MPDPTTVRPTMEDSVTTHYMAKLKLDLTGDQTPKDYFTQLVDRLDVIGASRGDLAKEMGMDRAQLTKYFTADDPNPTLKTIVQIEEAIVTLRRRKAQQR